MSKQYGLDVNPNAYIRDISVGMQQRVEILKTLYRGANVLRTNRSINATRN